MQTPPPFDPQIKRDASHLKLLVIFHYIYGAFSLLGLGFLVAHYLFMQFMMNSEEMRAEQETMPEGFMVILMGIYIVLGFIVVLFAILNVLSARFIRKRKGRIFSLVIAGINCLNMPIGTALGVFTFIVLLRDSVTTEYKNDTSNQEHLS